MVISEVIIELGTTGRVHTFEFFFLQRFAIFLHPAPNFSLIPL